MKTAELTGALLDHWVAWALYFGDRTNASDSLLEAWNPGSFFEKPPVWSPSTDWAQGGLLVEKYKVFVQAPRDHNVNRDHWVADIDGGHCSYFGKGDTPLQAICRAVVRAAFGDEVEEVGV